MGLKSYKDGLKKLDIALVFIAEHYGKPKLFFWIDALIAYISYGVTPNQYIGFRFFEKSRLERSEFYTRRQYKRFERELNDPKYYSIFWDKEKFNAAFSDFIHRDWLFCGDASEKQISDFLAHNKKIIVKPTSASSGKGIHILSDTDTINDLIASKSLLEEFVLQHHSMSELNPSSVNTVRVYTLLDRDSEPHILSATIRVGGVNSEVDNFHAGGVAYPLDINYGFVTAAGRNIRGEKCLFHPGTNMKMIGFEVPEWNSLKEFVFRAAKVFPSSRLIAWDVAVLEDGFEMIEGNYNGDPNMMQAPSDTGKRREIEFFK